MRNRLLVIAVLLTGLISGCQSMPTIPAESAASLSVHFSYPFHGKDTQTWGRMGPGFELHDIDREKSTARLVVFPNRGKPVVSFLSGDRFRRFMREWEEIGLMRCDKHVFANPAIRTTIDGKEVIRLINDSWTLVVIARNGEKESTLSIYAPEFTIQALEGRPESKALHDALDLIFRTAGESYL